MFAYLDGESRSSYRSKFIVGRSFTEGGHNYHLVCKWLVNQYARAVDPDKLMRMEMQARLDGGDLIVSILYLDEVHTNAGFKYREKHGMQRKAAMEHNRLSEFLLFKGPITHEALKEAIYGYVRNCEFFVSKFSSEGSRPATSIAAAEVMCNDVCSIEQKSDVCLDQLVHQFENRTMKIENKGLASQDVWKTLCTYCRKPGHTATNCRSLKSKNMQCNYC